MKKMVKNVAKFTTVTCVATGVVALVASGVAVGAVAEGFKAAKNIMKKTFAEKQQEEDASEEVQKEAEVVEVDVEKIEGEPQENSKAE